MRLTDQKTPLPIHAFFICYALICIIPFMVVVSASFTSVTDLSFHGFSVIPPKFDTSAYQYLFKNPSIYVKAYGVTIFISIVGTFLSVLVMSMAGYALARPTFRVRNAVTWFLFFPTLFSGGLTSSYIINTQYLHLTDSLWSMILPGLVNVFHVFIIRTFFKQLPDGLFEAAKIDGASELGIYSKIALPLSKPVLATVSFLGVLSRWNEWYNAMLYIRTPDKYPLQYLLQRMMNNIKELLDAMEHSPMTVITEQLPGENLRMALLVVCIGPIMLIFPFFQKYFTKGMTIGAVKG